MSDESEYSLIESFHIDNGQLRGLSPQQCFVLGVEWQTFYDKLRVAQLAGDEEPCEGLGVASFHATVRVENLDRLSRLLRKHNRPFTTQINSCGEWVDIEVGEAP